MMQIQFFVSVEGSDSDGDGTFAKPFRTVDFSVSKLSSGKTLYIMEGTYKENICGRKGTEAEPITIKAAPGAHAVIDGGGKLNENIIELEASSSDIIISDLELQNGWGRNIQRKIQPLNQERIFVVCNNKIHDIDGNNDDTFCSGLLC